MATVDLANYNLTIGPAVNSKLSPTITLKSVAALTSAYTGWTSDWFPVLGRWSRASVILTWTLGDETSMQVVLETSEDASVAITDDIDGAATAGAVTVSPLVLTYTKTNYTTTGIIRRRLDVSDVRYFRVKAKATGGTPTGTLSATVVCGKGDI